MISWQSMTLSLPTVTEGGRKVHQMTSKFILRNLQMIDNPLPDQVMAEKDQLHLQRNFEEHCKTHAIEIAKHYNVYPELHDDFAEYYHDCMSQNPHLFDHTCVHLDDSYIDDWWDEVGDFYDDITGGPYDIDPTPQHLYDDTGGEPPISAEERNRNSLDSKKESHGHRYS